MQAGLAFNPKTPIPTLQHYLPFLSFVLILTTEPESTNCTYLPSILKKVDRGKKQKGIEKVLWEVDGGFTVENISDATAVGADIVVSGRGVFMKGAIEKNINKMKKVINN
jgi:ribulose-phosphate 3-epimerase